MAFFASLGFSIPLHEMVAPLARPVRWTAAFRHDCELIGCSRCGSDVVEDVRVRAGDDTPGCLRQGPDRHVLHATAGRAEERLRGMQGASRFCQSCRPSAHRWARCHRCHRCHRCQSCRPSVRSVLDARIDGPGKIGPIGQSAGFLLGQEEFAEQSRKRAGSSSEQGAASSEQRAASNA